MEDLFKSVINCGCAAKVPPCELSSILSRIPTKNPAVLVGLDTLDDAGIFRIDNKTSLVQTVDFFPPVARNPRDYGRIAASNALSDVYAMGGVPKTALAILCCPSELLKTGTISEMHLGANEKLAEAGCELLGGHSVIDPQLKFGFCVTGFVDTHSYFDNSRANPGDYLVLTKPLGTGITTNAILAGIASLEQEKTIVECMVTLNRDAADIARQVGATTVTDITGFGFLGHSMQLCLASGTSMEIYLNQLPLFDGVQDFAKTGLLSAATYSNRKYVGSRAEFETSIPQHYQDILFDPQTSGGLLICCPEKKIHKLMSLAVSKLTQPYAIVGRVTNKSKDSVITIKAGEYDLPG